MKETDRRADGRGARSAAKLGAAPAHRVAFRGATTRHVGRAQRGAAAAAPALSQSRASIMLLQRPAAAGAGREGLAPPPRTGSQSRQMFQPVLVTRVAAVRAKMCV